MENKKIPRHIAIIMDGNRRWAKKRGLSPSAGHQEGYFNFKKIAEQCWEAGVKILTVYAFSSENWNRDKKEVSFLMRLFERMLKKEKKFFNKNNVRLNVIGDIEKLPGNLKKIVYGAVAETKNNTRGILNLAISYGGRAEIIEAVKKIVENKISADKINEEVFDRHLYTAGQPDPDLLIRTGGEQRLSGFLTWQSVYSELYFSPKLWPDFKENDLNEAIKEFQSRQRRFGK